MSAMSRSRNSGYQELLHSHAHLAAAQKLKDYCLRMAWTFDQEGHRHEQDGRKRHAAICRFIRDSALKGNTEPAAQFALMKRIPPTVDEVMESPEFLGRQLEYYPMVKQDIRSINRDVFVGETPVFEAYLGGATGTGKSHSLKTTTVYQTIVMDCFDPPQGMVGEGKPASEPLIWTLQSVDAATTRRVLYTAIRNLFEAMPYASRYMRWNRDKDSALEFDNGIWITPGAAALNSTIGGIIPGGAFDEFSFLQRIENSARSGTAGGAWDQAEEVYKNVSRRRRGRMRTRGFSVGVLCFASSVKYANDFLERRMATATEKSEQNVEVIRHKQYEVSSAGYCGDRFRLLVGAEEYPTRILRENERAGAHYPASAQVEEVPVEYRTDFERDPEGSLRDFLGIASAAIAPFITRRDTVRAAFNRGQEIGLQQLVPRDISALASHGMPTIVETHLPPASQRALPHTIHVDLSISGDRCGIAMARPDGHVAVERAGGVKEMMPAFVVPLAVALQPSKSHNVSFAEVRAWILKLVNEYKFNVQTVTFDGFQSRDSVQILAGMGLHTYEASVDHTLQPYEYLRDTLYEGRLALAPAEPAVELLRRELVGLEMRQDKRKVDHNPQFSKDLADAVCGAVWSASRLREATPGKITDAANREISRSSIAQAGDHGRPQSGYYAWKRQREEEERKRIEEARQR